MDLGLKNRVALVTGAGGQKGFGKAIALTLAREGCKVIVADINLDGAKKTAAEILALGVESMAIKADISINAEVAEMVDAGLSKFGQIDILVNNAGGIFQHKLFTEKTEAECNRDIDLNLKGAMNCIRAVVKKSMLPRKYGKIVNITTIGAHRGVPSTTVYNAAKSGIIGMTKSLAVDLGPSGININCVAPGLGLTDFGGGNPPEEILNTALAHTPNRRTTTPQDIANTVAFLVSDISSDILGQNIAVDGGDSVT
jgi:3-oxoacyl-[acyl-carrier protein] reductase